MAKKKVVASFKLMAPGGKATPAPPLGPVLGANGVNPGQFIQQFNDRTRELNGKVVGVIVTVYHDRSFSFEVKSSPTSVLLKQAAGLEKSAFSKVVLNRIDPMRCSPRWENWRSEKKLKTASSSGEAWL